MNGFIILPILAAVICGGLIYLVFTTTEEFKKDIETNIKKWDMEDQGMLLELATAKSCDNMFISLMKFEDDWFRSYNRDTAWNIYKQRCFDP